MTRVGWPGRARTPRRGLYPMGQRFHLPVILQHVDSLHKRNLIALHYQAARLLRSQHLESDQGRKGRRRFRVRVLV